MGSKLRVIGWMVGGVVLGIAGLGVTYYLMTNEFDFGNQRVKTGVATVVQDRNDGPLDVATMTIRDRWQDDPFGLGIDHSAVMS